MPNLQPLCVVQINTRIAAASTIPEDEKALIAANKDAFRVWQETAGKPVDELELDEDDFDPDAPLTDAMGRPCLVPCRWRKNVVICRHCQVWKLPEKA